MAKSEAPKTVKLAYKGTSADVATVWVAEEDADRLLASGVFTKPSTRKSTD